MAVTLKSAPKPVVVMSVAEVRKKCAPLVVYELGEGLEVWKVNIDLLQEQSVNARSQSVDTFLQLTKNIADSKRLESMPFAAVTQKGLEIVSGHHRVRAARKAGLKEIWVLVDVTGLARDRIKSKQLAHNSLQGQDDADLVRQIFDSIGDVAAKIEAFIEPQIDTSKIGFNLSGKDFEANLALRVVVLMFLPAQNDVFKQAVERVQKLCDANEAYVATRDEYETLVAATGAVAEAFDIRSVPTIMAKMAEIVLAHTKPIIEANNAEKVLSGGNSVET
jgi:hypothetical protein